MTPSKNISIFEQNIASDTNLVVSLLHHIYNFNNKIVNVTIPMLLP